MPVDQHVQRMIEELKEALAQTIRSSAAVNAAARKIRREGVSLHLVLSFENDGPADDGEAQTSSSQSESPQIERLRSIQRVRPRHERSELERPGSEPAFRLNGNDVAVLESLGIDPTRRVRGSSRRRRRPPGAL